MLISMHAGLFYNYDFSHVQTVHWLPSSRFLKLQQRDILRYLRYTKICETIVDMMWRGVRGTKHTSCILRSFHFGAFILPSKRQITTHFLYSSSQSSVKLFHYKDQSGDTGKTFVFIVYLHLVRSYS